MGLNMHHNIANQLAFEGVDREEVQKPTYYN